MSLLFLSRLFDQWAPPLRTVLVGLLCWGTEVFASASGPDPAAALLRTKVDELVQPVMAKHAVPGLVLGITAEGRTTYFCYGVASRSEEKKVDQNTLFEIGSVSKTFTATLAAHANVTGRLSFSDSPGQYIPELRGTALDRASLLHLGTYTAGDLPLQFPDGVDSHAQMLAFFREWTSAHGPGQVRSYSNPSIGLLGHVTSLALQRPFVEEMETRLLPALGLPHTHVHVPASAMAQYAWGHDAEGRKTRVSPGVFDAEAYGIKSSAADLVRYVELNLDPSSLQADYAKAVEYTHEGFYEVGPMVQGLGWEQYPYPVSLDKLLAGNSPPVIFEPNRVRELPLAERPVGPRLFNKTGSTRGFGAYLAFVPARKIGVVLLANKNFPIEARVRIGWEILTFLSAASE